MRSLTALPLCLLLLLPGASAAEEAPDLSGTWQLDERLSETLRGVMRDAMLENATEPRAHQRWKRAENRERQMMHNSPLNRLTIEQREQQIEMRFSDGASRTLHTDGRELPAMEALRIKGGRASWEGPRLMIENETVRGARTEYWDLSEGGKQLIVTTYVDLGEPHGVASFRRFYNLEPGSKAAEAESESAAEEDGGGDGD